jgi:iron complex outermembrane receptor protein
MKNSSSLTMLLAASALSAGMTGAASAQTTAASANSTATLGQIIVTATKQEQSLNRVPLSISAMSQKDLESQGIRDVYDLARTVPALSFREFSAGAAQATQGTVIAIRGIFSTAGAATTGAYLDDVPLQVRSVGNSGAGFQFPDLFDLQRVEVLRGPQGTLFGGSTEGGAVRFITPTPSLTSSDFNMRAQASTTEGGDPSYQVGVATGGPIVPDKLGFRASVFVNNVGGYLDHIAPSTGVQFLKNTNSERNFSGRLALRWAPVEHLTIEPSFYVSDHRKNDTDGFWFNSPAYTLPAQSYGANGQVASASNPASFTRPALNYSALNFYGPGKTGDLVTSPREDIFRIYTLKMEYDAGPVIFTSVTAYRKSKVKASSIVTPNIAAVHGVATSYSANVPIYYGFNQLSPTTLSIAPVTTHGNYTTQEFRLSSAPGHRLSWVAGVFYNNSALNPWSDVTEELGPAVVATRGANPNTYYGLTNGGYDLYQQPNGAHYSSRTIQKLDDRSLAGFAEASYGVTDALKVTAGARVSREKFSYYSCGSGYLRNALTCDQTPATAQLNLFSGSSEVTPVTPKASVSYQIDPRNMVYVTYARGFRNGGFNTPVPNTPTCTTALAAIGGVSPRTYDPDYVNSYEAGGKFGLLNGRLQVNASAYNVDWKNIQIQVALPGCPFNYVANGATARSQGFDLSSQLRVVGGLTADLNVGYDSAKYTQTVSNKTAAGVVQSVVLYAGNELPIPPWTVNFGLEYRFGGVGRQWFVRGDYEYTSKYHRTFGPGTLSYSPDLYLADATNFVSAKAGVELGNAEVSLFVQNLFNSEDIRARSQGRACGLGIADPTCASPTSLLFSTGNTFRPREVGITVTYRR